MTTYKHLADASLDEKFRALHDLLSPDIKHVVLVEFEAMFDREPTEGEQVLIFMGCLLSMWVTTQWLHARESQ